MYFVIPKTLPKSKHLSPSWHHNPNNKTITLYQAQSLRSQELRLIMSIELSKLLIPSTNLFNSRINLFLKYLQLHIGGIVLQALLLITKIDGTFQSTCASREIFWISKF